MTELVAGRGPADTPAHEATAVFHGRESVVRSYCWAFPAVLASARGSTVVAEDGTGYLDFFSGARGLNYGHNHEHIKRWVIDYLEGGGLVHALDFFAPAKREFLDRFGREILQPRRPPYRVQFRGGTGTDAVEAALKLARKHTGRSEVIAFSGAYHGVSRGSLATTSAPALRAAAGTALDEVTFLLFPVGPPGRVRHRGAAGAAAHGRPVRPGPTRRRNPQDRADGGRCPPDSRRRPAGAAPTLRCPPDRADRRRHPGRLRTHRRLLLVRADRDHPGTFRGQQLAFIGVCAALDLWHRAGFLQAKRDGAKLLRELWQDNNAPPGVEIRCEGYAMGIDLSAVGGRAAARADVARCFEKGLMAEATGRDQAVVKLLPPLNTSLDMIGRGCEVVHYARAVSRGTRPPLTTCEESRGGRNPRGVP